LFNAALPQRRSRRPAERREIPSGPAVTRRRFRRHCDGQAPDDVQAQASAMPHRLGGEERVKDAVSDLRGDAASVVDDAHHHALMLAFRQYLYAARVGHGVKGVVNEICPDLVEFAGKAANERQAWFRINQNLGGFSPRPWT
jgi:hypothetical protein